MNLWLLSWSYIRGRKLETFLSVMLLALGTATMVVLLLFSRQFETSLTRNAEGIDLVVGAKGSPVQLILSSVYHMDVPTGNIPERQVDTIVNHPAVEEAIPLAMGDSFEGFRIVGAPHAYVSHYGAELAGGRLWEKPLEVVLGANVAKRTGASLGGEIVSIHGLNLDGHAHDERPMRVVGRLRPTGTVLDRLVLTSPETYWAMHDQHEGGSGREYTAILVKYSSPMAAMMFPAFINQRTQMQAASPAFETARLFTILGVGLDAIRAFGVILMVAAALSVFVSLYNALQARRYDLAVMRSLGASRARLLMHILLEGVLLAGMGAVMGFLLGHLASVALAAWARGAGQSTITGWAWAPAELAILAGALAVGVVAAILPAIQAYRADIAGVLARG